MENLLAKWPYVKYLQPAINSRQSERATAVIPLNRCGETQALMGISPALLLSLLQQHPFQINQFLFIILSEINSLISWYILLKKLKKFVLELFIN